MLLYMKKPMVLFALKCTVILYFAACTGINDYATAVSATPHVTKGAWKMKLIGGTENKDLQGLAGYTFSFNTSGKLFASRNGETTTGNWAEDDILKMITINFDTQDPALGKLNSGWQISQISNTGIFFNNTDHSTVDRLEITSL